MELALLLPWLLLLADGVAELGLLIYNQSVLISASSMAARAGIASGTGKLSTQEVGHLALDYANDHLKLVANNTSASTQVVQATAPMFQQPLSVTVQYTYQGLLLGGFLSVLKLQPVMHASCVMYNE